MKPAHSIPRTTPAYVHRALPASQGEPPGPDWIGVWVMRPSSSSRDALPEQGSLYGLAIAAIVIEFYHQFAPLTRNRASPLCPHRPGQCAFKLLRDGGI